ncbi:MAG: SDR family oxidoreductase [Gammaproteobacteria bacterium]|nr:SDR family oxidoreductase [Gammaproteobacteria bacterium]
MTLTKYERVQEELKITPRKWLVTGVAGFIGSNLLEKLLRLDQTVVGLDNFSTGYHHNLAEVQAAVSTTQWEKFRFIEGDIRDLDRCHEAVTGVDYVLHQAALGSVPRSIEAPLVTNDVNVNGFLNMMVASRDAGVKRFVYAASSSTYGDHQSLPKVEEVIGSPLSPYAATKYFNEVYADVFHKVYQLNTIGLRYFNVFGQRQDPEGAYAAVIPRWIAAMIRNEKIVINGDGKTSRDFCFVDNVVQANLLAAMSGDSTANEIYNVAVGEQTTLNELFFSLANAYADTAGSYERSPTYGPARAGDVRHSMASVAKIMRKLAYSPEVRVKDGIYKSLEWYLAYLNRSGCSSATNSSERREAP